MVGSGIVSKRIHGMLSSTLAFKIILGAMFLTPFLVAMPTTTTDWYKTTAIGFLAALVAYLIRYIVTDQRQLLRDIHVTLGELRDLIREKIP